MYNDIQKYKILYTENARERLHNFLTFMRSNCKYFDSGLHNEFEMIENYIKRYDDFVDDILNIIEDRFKE
ncbi:MAG: hypothetical protein LBQ59_02865 [Candidatus Peribacteria bacterium]|jgi:hypothetical protein|nr:hypothetical protein [Candidatus Peribacteria bacterium]